MLAKPDVPYERFPMECLLGGVAQQRWVPLLEEKKLNGSTNLQILQTCWGTLSGREQTLSQRWLNWSSWNVQRFISGCWAVLWPQQIFKMKLIFYKLPCRAEAFVMMWKVILNDPPTPFLSGCWEVFGPTQKIWKKNWFLQNVNRIRTVPGNCGYPR